MTLRLKQVGFAVIGRCGASSGVQVTGECFLGIRVRPQAMLRCRHCRSCDGLLSLQPAPDQVEVRPVPGARKRRLDEASPRPHPSESGLSQFFARLCQLFQPVARLDCGRPVLHWLPLHCTVRDSLPFKTLGDAQLLSQSWNALHSGARRFGVAVEARVCCNSCLRSAVAVEGAERGRPEGKHLEVEDDVVEENVEASDEDHPLFNLMLF